MSEGERQHHMKEVNDDDRSKYMKSLCIDHYCSKTSVRRRGEFTSPRFYWHPYTMWVSVILQEYWCSENLRWEGGSDVSGRFSCSSESATVPSVLIFLLPSISILLKNGWETLDLVEMLKRFINRHWTPANRSDCWKEVRTGGEWREGNMISTCRIVRSLPCYPLGICRQALRSLPLSTEKNIPFVVGWTIFINLFLFEIRSAWFAVLSLSSMIDARVIDLSYHVAASRVVTIFCWRDKLWVVSDRGYANQEIIDLCGLMNRYFTLENATNASLLKVKQ